MSVIANFKKRQLEKAQKEKVVVADKLESKAKEHVGQKLAAGNQALELLATLLNVPKENAIAEAERYVEQNIQFFATDLTSDKDKAASSDLQTEAESISDELLDSANSVQSAASDIENSADKASEAASDLAYSADDISAATEELKEVAEDVKKPSAEARKSSNGAKNSKQKSNSKK